MAGRARDRLVRTGALLGQTASCLAYVHASITFHTESAFHIPDSPPANLWERWRSLARGLMVVRPGELGVARRDRGPMPYGSAGFGGQIAPSTSAQPS
jgi:hypothetical protein